MRVDDGKRATVSRGYICSLRWMKVSSFTLREPVALDHLDIWQVHDRLQERGWI